MKNKANEIANVPTPSQGIKVWLSPKPVLSTKMRVRHTEVMNVAGSRAIRYHAPFFAFVRYTVAVQSANAARV